MKIRCLRCLRLWGERYVERASCPHCGGALESELR